MQCSTKWSYYHTVAIKLEGLITTNIPRNPRKTIFTIRLFNRLFFFLIPILRLDLLHQRDWLQCYKCVMVYSIGADVYWAPSRPLMGEGITGNFLRWLALLVVIFAPKAQWVQTILSETKPIRAQLVPIGVLVELWLIFLLIDNF